MDGYSISHVAERSGFSPSALRFYEQAGLIQPGRTASGYRCYDDTHLDRLSFIGRAKGFGLSLGEITELLTLLEDDECAPVQGRLRDLVDAKIADARTKVAELTAFTVELERVAAALETHTPDGPCDETCGCWTDREVADTQPITLGERRALDPPPIACSLGPDEAADRIATWRATVADARARHDIADGTRITFDRRVDVAELATLIAAEQSCCPFFTFTLAVGPEVIALDIVAPAEARPMIDALVGAS